MHKFRLDSVIISPPLGVSREFYQRGGAGPPLTRVGARVNAKAVQRGGDAGVAPASPKAFRRGLSFAPPKNNRQRVEGTETV